MYQFTWANRNLEGHRFSWQEFQDFQRQNPAFSDVAAFNRVSLTRVEGHLMLGHLVTGNYFQMLGVSALRGRTLLPEDAEIPGTTPVAVLSSDAWTNKFGRDPNIIGKQIPIHGHTVQIVGVAQAGFRGISEAPLDFWVPVTLAPQLEEDASLFGPAQPRTPDRGWPVAPRYCFPSGRGRPYRLGAAAHGRPAGCSQSHARDPAFESDHYSP